MVQIFLYSIWVDKTCSNTLGDLNLDNSRVRQSGATYFCANIYLNGINLLENVLLKSMRKASI